MRTGPKKFAPVLTREAGEPKSGSFGTRPSRSVPGFLGQPEPAAGPPVGFCRFRMRILFFDSVERDEKRGRRGPCGLLEGSLWREIDVARFCRRDALVGGDAYGCWSCLETSLWAETPSGVVFA